ncbi:sensory transduction regulatory protein [Winogradskyella sp. PG-2]|nr:response regulator transcription factor [Winogradskyella sp. PG-2]BAO75162.1 sensory transduction regulatory protein [Winogradskyella sp. PG-2]
MKKPSIYIVEDEFLIASTIETALIKQGYTVKGDAEDYTSALRDINILKPDVIVIDIKQQGSKDGIDLALELDKQKLPYLFLTSQTDTKTINRVKLTNPLGYITKPFTEEGLRSNLELAWHNYNAQNIKYFTLKSEGRTYKIDQDSILYLKAFDNYCYVYTTTKWHLVPHTLKHMSEQLEKTSLYKPIARIG